MLFSFGNVQEARRVMVAEWQHVVYNEFLPNLLGWRVMEVYGLSPMKEGSETLDFPPFFFTNN